MKQSCTQCSAEFEITNSDLEFYEKVSPEFGGKKYAIPPPTLCPVCREQHRLSFRNEWHLYHRKCDLTGRQMVSVYSPEKKHTVYEQSVWWSDQFDPLAFGRDFDFSRPFFEQWQELSISVPRMSIHNAKSDNCDYTNYSAENKNCYMVVGGLGAEDCYYSYRVFYSKDVLDCYDLYRCELCYECSECKNLYQSTFCDHCHDSSSLVRCSDCVSCTNCFGCIGLRQKSHCIFNEQYSPEEYNEKVSTLSTDVQGANEKLKQLLRSTPVRNLRLLNAEGCTGDIIVDSQACRECFTVKNSQNMAHCFIGEGNLSCGDCNFFDNCELQWNCSNLEKNYNVLCANLAWYVTDSLYVTSCFNSSQLFGCIGMKKHRFCIFNKQYTEKEYAITVAAIIEHMQKTGEWGQYFPPAMSPFGYNETVAAVEHPLSKDAVLERGWSWYEDYQKKEQYLGPHYKIPTTIDDVSDDITKHILTCSVSGKPYKVIPQELRFYRTMHLPIPSISPEERHAARMQRRNPRTLWNRSCAKCQLPIATSYAPERPETVYCEDCYLQTVY